MKNHFPRKTVCLVGIPLCYALWNELIFTLFLRQGFTVHKVLFSLLWGLLLYWLGQLSRDRAMAWRVQTIPAFLTSAIYCAQVSYFTLFETPFYLKSISGAGDTMSDFFSVVVDAVIAVAPAFLLLLGYFILWTTLYRKLFLTVPYDEHRSFRSVVVLTAGIIVTLSAGILDYHGAVSPSYMMLYEFVPTESVRTFGMLATEFLDIKYNLLHLQATRPETIHLDMDTIAIDTAETQSAGENLPEAAQEGAVQPDAQPIVLEGGGHESTDVDTTVYDPAVYHALDLNFSRELEKEEEERNTDYADMNSWFSSRTPSKRNAYTGLFAGKNLILITAEAFSRFIIDPELTPTLYRMASEGFQFPHFYTGIWGVSTSDGEFVATTGLIPKAGTWSYTEIADNYMPFAFGNQFREMGYLTQAYHNHSYTYYNRNLSYPNMGYDFYAKGHGLTITDTWPESDVEMIEQSVPLFAESAPFHVYYMSVSGHLEYNWEANAMSVKHRSRLAGTKYEHSSEEVQAYVACQLELEDALTALIADLEAAGVLEDTVIALSPDHYPYGLTTEQYAELRGGEYDPTFGTYESTFLIWNSAMTEPVVSEVYCSSLDIAPTLSNLFDLPYDSRLFIGTDIFGDVAPIVCLQDRSFITDKIMYDNTNQKITQLTSEPLSETYLGDCISTVKNMFYYSAKIIELDYYGYLYDKLPAG